MRFLSKKKAVRLRDRTVHRPKLTVQKAFVDLYRRLMHI